MTGHNVATANWRRLEDGGKETCRLLSVDDGWSLAGHVRCDAYDLTYRVDCMPGWQTRVATVAGTFQGKECNWTIKRSDDGWQLNGLPIGLADCIDIDLAITPATNTLPIRRLALAHNTTADLSAAWFRPDNGGSLTRLNQSYSRLSEDEYAYTSENFSTRLKVHRSGLVTRYGDLWEGAVQDG